MPKDTLRPGVNRVIGVAVGLARLRRQQQDRTTRRTVATAQITIRVPVGAFETAINRINRLPGVKVLGDSESGADVTAQYTNLQAQLNAATVERDSMLDLLAAPSNLGDILRCTTASRPRTRGRPAAGPDQPARRPGDVLVDRDHDHREARREEAGRGDRTREAVDGSRQGVEGPRDRASRTRSSGSSPARAARSIVLLAALALVFGIRYLYPVVRRALL